MTQALYAHTNNKRKKKKMETVCQSKFLYEIENLLENTAFLN
jgi:hypothetical protein